MFEYEVFGINGVIETPAGVTEEEFHDELFAFLEARDGSSAVGHGAMTMRRMSDGTVFGS